MKFNPLPESDLDLFQDPVLIAPGEYAFNVISAEDYVNKAGNEGIKLTMAIKDDKGQAHYLVDYLSSAAIFKIKQFCKAVDLKDEYQQGELFANMCLNRNAILIAAVEKGRLKDDGMNFYPDRMVVKKYIPSIVPF